MVERASLYFYTPQLTFLIFLLTRAHLRDIRDRSVLRLFEATDMGGGVFPGAVGVGSLVMPSGAASCSGPNSWDAVSNISGSHLSSVDYRYSVKIGSRYIVI